MISRGKRKYLVELVRGMVLRSRMLKNLLWQWEADATMGNRQLSEAARVQLRDSLKKHLTREKCEQLHRILFPEKTSFPDGDILFTRNTPNPTYLTLQRGKHRQHNPDAPPFKILSWDEAEFASRPMSPEEKADALKFDDYVGELSKLSLDDMPVRRIKVKPMTREDIPRVVEMGKDLSIIQAFVRGGAHQ